MPMNNDLHDILKSFSRKLELLKDELTNTTITVNDDPAGQPFACVLNEKPEIIAILNKISKLRAAVDTLKAEIPVGKHIIQNTWINTDMDDYSKTKES